MVSPEQSGSAAEDNDYDQGGIHRVTFFDKGRRQNAQSGGGTVHRVDNVGSGGGTVHRIDRLPEVETEVAPQAEHELGGLAVPQVIEQPPEAS